MRAERKERATCWPISRTCSSPPSLAKRARPISAHARRLPASMPELKQQPLVFPTRHCAKHRRSWQNRPHCSNRGGRTCSVAETLERQLAQRRQELAEAQARCNHRRAARFGSRGAGHRRRRANAQGAGARSDYLAARERFDSMQGHLDGARIAVRRYARGRRGPCQAGKPRPLPGRIGVEPRARRSRATRLVAERAAHRTGRRVSRGAELQAPMDGIS